MTTMLLLLSGPLDLIHIANANVLDTSTTMHPFATLETILARLEDLEAIQAGLENEKYEKY